MKTSHKDVQFTCIGRTTVSGEPIMIIVIFATEESLFGQRMDHDTRMSCVGEGKIFHGDLACIFQGQNFNLDDLFRQRFYHF